jgi:hypothetical protein
MRGYGLDYWQVMSLPLAAFWGANRNLDRLRAEEDLRALHNGLVAGARDGSATKAYREQLETEMGQVYRRVPVLDRKGLHALKALGKVG